MSVETFQFLDSLVPTEPGVDDGLVNGDDHIRGIKLTLKQSFPNITGAVTATQTDLNTVSSGISKLLSAGTFFSANATDGFVNSLAGDIDVQLQGVVAATFQRTGSVNFLKVKGALQVDTSITGPGMCPIGAAVVWPSDTLPPTTEGVFTWCNGASFTKAAYPIAHDRLNGNGTTFTVPNYQEVSLVGKSTMGGASAPGYLNSISSSLKAVLHAVFGADAVALDVSTMPNHDHTASSSDSGHTHPVDAHTNLGTSTQVGNPSNSFVSPGGTTGIGNANITTIVNARGGGLPHNNVQPSKVVNWIIRIG